MFILNYPYLDNKYYQAVIIGSYSLISLDDVLKRS